MYFPKHISCILLLVLFSSDFSAANLRICGKSLDQFLDMVCVNGFNGKNLRAKKFDPSIDLEENSIESDLEPSTFTPFFLDKLYDNQQSLMAKTRRRRHDGVADECCIKACTLPELLSYCR